MHIYEIAENYLFSNDAETIQLYFEKKDDYYTAHQLQSIDKDAFALVKFLKEVIVYWDYNIQKEISTFMTDERLCNIYCKKFGFEKIATIIQRKTK